MRNALFWVELTVLLLLAWFFVTQIILPVMESTKLFPLFTSKKPKLQEELASAKTETQERGLEQSITAEQAKSKEMSDANATPKK